MNAVTCPQCRGEKEYHPRGGLIGTRVTCGICNGFGWILPDNEDIEKLQKRVSELELEQEVNSASILGLANGQGRKLVVGHRFHTRQHLRSPEHQDGLPEERRT